MNHHSKRSKKISVVLPAYQEEENLRLLLPRIHTVLEEIGASYEILVVDTMVPMDSTEEVCKECGAIWLPREGGNSYGDAIRTGINKTLGDHVVFMDADGSHAPEWITKLYAHRKINDLVIASRYVKNGYTENSWLLVAMSRTLNFTYGLVLGVKCHDLSNSFRLYDGTQLRALKLKCNNFDIVEEILLKLVRNNKKLRIYEEPFTFKQRMFGKTKRNLVLFVFTYVYTLVKLRFFA